MLIDERTKLDSILQAAALSLDIPDHVYEDATLKYEDIGEHLAAEDSDLRDYNPRIYVQGSFRLGTVIHPYGRGDEYDIDLVCQLEIKKESVTQKELKEKVGKRLKERADLEKILEPSRRCWMLDYPSEPNMPAFHMDVLPVIPNLERKPTGILLTDTELTHWQKSNPISYAEWFKQKMEVIFQSKKKTLADSMSLSLDEVPDWRIKTPLQQCVQILKRHRDIYFEQKGAERPVSIALTTLAAHAYQNEEGIFDALVGIVQRMPQFIEKRNDKWWIQNPIEDGENFADKWNEYPERQIAFQSWLKKLSLDFTNLSKAETVAEGIIRLNESLGKQTMDRVAAELGVMRANLFPDTVPIIPTVPALGNTSHAQAPTTKFQVITTSKYTVKVTAGVYFKNGKKKGSFLWHYNRPVSKNVWLKFHAKTNAPEPHSIQWQVVNTGDEAFSAKELRGEFYKSDDPDKYVQWESTAYRGTHWVEAFVINSQGECVARSGKVDVKVR